MSCDAQQNSNTLVSSLPWVANKLPVCDSLGKSKGHCYAKALKLLLEKNFMSLKIRMIAVLYGDCMKSYIYLLHSFEENQFFFPYPQRQRFGRWLFLKGF